MRVELYSIIEQSERLVDRLREESSGGATPTVRIGMSDRSVSTELMAAFVAARLGARIQVVSIRDPQDALEQVRVGRIDCAVVPDGDAPRDLSYECLPDDVLVLALPPHLGHIESLEQLAATGPLPVVTHGHCVGEDAVDALADFGIVGTVVLSGVSSAALPGLVAGGLGAAVIARSAVRPVTAAGGAVIDLPVPSTVRTVLAYSPDSLAPLMNSFLEQLFRGWTSDVKPDRF
ncbi:MAG: LysR family transcriptional regulator substrate-binding protein [Rhodococcus sp. (in: high G+C Gram-positive bacteria)]|uniref:LysR family transcriptional regulator substrate-binding protein n=1 Tax=Rhodococcus sp. TaxID=1831 RepID=UPI002ADA3C59|nr:LysR family transcriptional regulator substrate-binding protein [Rhodococcus sp. (in: high G+C Gram-positive bacteria)]